MKAIHAAPIFRSLPAPARAALLVVVGTLLLAVSAKVQVPFWPVPMTMQTLAVLLVGVAYGSRLGTATVLAYLAEGLAGLPVFAGSAAGAAYLAGPTGGYLVGFVAAAALAGALAERGWARIPVRAAALFVLGHAVLFVPGVLWLATLTGWDRAVALGLVPFLAGTAVKSLLGAALTVAGRRAASQHG